MPKIDLEAMIDQIDKQLQEEHVQGYMDGYETDTPEPGPNQSEAYTHSWKIGRAEKEGRNKDLPSAFESEFNARKIRDERIFQEMDKMGLIKRY